jgi:hypothetical protein
VLRRVRQLPTRAITFSATEARVRARVASRSPAGQRFRPVHAAGNCEAAVGQGCSRHCGRRQDALDTLAHRPRRSSSRTRRSGLRSSACVVSWGARLADGLRGDDADAAAPMLTLHPREFAAVALLADVAAGFRIYIAFGANSLWIWRATDCLAARPAAARYSDQLRRTRSLTLNTNALHRASADVRSKQPLVLQLRTPTLNRQ